MAAVSAMFVDELAAALESAHPDVRVRAAAARAALGDRGRWRRCSPR